VAAGSQELQQREQLALCSKYTRRFRREGGIYEVVIN
jgi:hypothetical protein